MTRQSFTSLSEGDLKQLEDDADLVAHNLALTESISRLGLRALSPEARRIYRMQLWVSKAHKEAVERRHAAERATFASLQEKFSTRIAAATAERDFLISLREPIDDKPGEGV